MWQIVAASRVMANAASDCVRTGEACLAHCIQMLSKGDTNVGACGET